MADKVKPFYIDDQGKRVFCLYPDEANSDPIRAARLKCKANTGNKTAQEELGRKMKTKMTIGQMTDCWTCKHVILEPGNIHCKAYPRGIPDEFLEDGEPHDRVMPDQVGDYIFERKN